MHRPQHSVMYATHGMYVPCASVTYPLPITIMAHHLHVTHIHISHTVYGVSRMVTASFQSLATFHVYNIASSPQPLRVLTEGRGSYITRNTAGLHSFALAGRLVGLSSMRVSYYPVLDFPEG